MITVVKSETPKPAGKRVSAYPDGTLLESCSTPGYYVLRVGEFGVFDFALNRTLDNSEFLDNYLPVNANLVIL